MLTMLTLKDNRFKHAGAEIGLLDLKSTKELLSLILTKTSDMV